MILLEEATLKYDIDAADLRLAIGRDDPEGPIGFMDDLGHLRVYDDDNLQIFLDHLRTCGNEGSAQYG